MKRCLQWRHQSTLKTIVCTFRRKHRSAKLTPSAYCAPAPRSAAQSWSLSQSQNLGAPICSLWSLESRSMARTTVMSCLCRECCLQSGACRENSSVSSRTALQHIGHGSLSSYYGKRPQTSLDGTYGQRTHQTLTQSTTGSGG